MKTDNNTYMYIIYKDCFILFYAHMLDSQTFLNVILLTNLYNTNNYKQSV